MLLANAPKSNRNIILYHTEKIPLTFQHLFVADNRWHNSGKVRHEFSGA